MSFKPINVKIKQEDDESPPREEPPSDAISTPSDGLHIKQEEKQFTPEPQSTPSTQTPINLKKASREILRKLACEGSLEASELLSERRAKDRAGYEQRKVHLANGRAMSEDVAEESMESSKTQEALPEDMPNGILEKDQEVSEEVENTEMRGVEEKVAKIDEQRWDREICWSIYEALGW